jgi:hypothetical protein
MMRSLILATILALLPLASSSAPQQADGPRFDGKALLLPTGYDTWPVVGTSLGLSYSGNTSGPGMFHRIYMNPSSYAAFKRTGQFPEGTMFVLEGHEAETRKSIAQGGYVEGNRMALEASVKDSSRFPNGWAYFTFDNGAKATSTPFADSQCHSCHLAHGEVDSVFVQFYPNLRGK